MLTQAQTATQEVLQEHKENIKLFYTEGDKAPEQTAWEDWGASFSGDVQKPSAHFPCDLLWVTCSSRTGLYDLQRSLSTPIILWFCHFRNNQWYRLTLILHPKTSLTSSRNWYEKGKKKKKTNSNNNNQTLRSEWWDTAILFVCIGAWIFFLNIFEIMTSVSFLSSNITCGGAWMI